jgi:hypothetical protein
VSLVRLCISIAVEWTSISENFRNSIQLTLRSPTVTCVELAGLVGLPLAFLAHCPALRSLTLTRVSFHDPDNFDFAALPDSPPTQLEHLDLDLDTYELNFLSRWILIPESPLVIVRLLSFACTISEPVDHLYVQLLLNASPSLQRLQLRKSINCEFLPYFPAVFCTSANEQIAGILDLRALGHLHTLSLDMPWPINQRVRRLAEELFFPLPPHTFALVLNIVTPNARPETVQLAGADGFLAGLQCITSVTVLLFPPRRPRVPKLIDVSDSFEQEMPLLANRFGKGALRVLRSS